MINLVLLDAFRPLSTDILVMHYLFILSSECLSIFSIVLSVDKSDLINLINVSHMYVNIISFPHFLKRNFLVS